MSSAAAARRAALTLQPQASAAWRTPELAPGSRLWAAGDSCRLAAQRATHCVLICTTVREGMSEAICFQSFPYVFRAATNTACSARAYEKGGTSIRVSQDLYDVVSIEESPSVNTISARLCAILSPLDDPARKIVSPRYNMRHSGEHLHPKPSHALSGASPA